MWCELKKIGIFNLSLFLAGGRGVKLLSYPQPPPPKKTIRCEFVHGAWGVEISNILKYTYTYTYRHHHDVQIPKESECQALW